VQSGGFGRLERLGTATRKRIPTLLERATRLKGRSAKRRTYCGEEEVPMGKERSMGTGDAEGQKEHQ